ncbi:uncharacterized protein LOC100212542 isoform X2 [Hydra vulgaris]|uniref:Uncharacterized protein LOC100212542 isoform X2 n=1 Tax=Hydra vulgaris TaxID=6087 RepID=A0ABM4C809_HYDVU
MPAGDMESEYSIGVNNRFNGIDNDIIDDPFELIRVAQEKPSKKEKEVKGKGKKDAAKKSKDSKPAKVETVAPVETAEKPKNESSDRRGGRGGGRGRGNGRGGFKSTDSPAEGGRKGFGGDNSAPKNETSKGACRRCNEEGHFAKDCTQAPASNGGNKGACHKCGGEGHFARECPNTETAPRSGACHKCGEEGHFARQCPKSGPPGGGACRKCNEVGHFARECPQNQNGTDSNSGFGAPPSGFSAPSSGFGAPSSGFGAPSGGFGAPSGGFGGSVGFSDSATDKGFGGSDSNNENRGGRGGFRGRGRGRGGRGASRGREFDRKSGSNKSSVKPTEKRDGSGAYNWGTPGEDNAGEEPQAVVSAPQSDGEAQEQGVESSEENKENTPEMTYEEYKKQLEESRSKPQYNLRKANEGVKVLKGKPLKKPSDEENEADGSLFFPKKYYEEKLKTSGRVKEHMNLEFQFAVGENRHLEDRSRRGRGGRGGRGGGRGGRKEDGGYASNSNIQLESKDEFPSLG